MLTSQENIVDLAQYDNLFHVWFRERVRNSKLEEDDNGIMESGLSHRICACHQSVPLGPVRFKL